MASGWRIRTVVGLVSDCAAITALHSAQSDHANSRTVPGPKSTAILARRSSGSATDTHRDPDRGDLAKWAAVAPAAPGDVYRRLCGGTALGER
jgi:hypothetical protein